SGFSQSAAQTNRRGFQNKRATRQDQQIHANDPAICRLITSPTWKSGASLCALLSVRPQTFRPGARSGLQKAVGNGQTIVVPYGTWKWSVGMTRNLFRTEHGNGRSE